MLVKPCLEKNEEFNLNYPNPRGGLFSASEVTTLWRYTNLFIIIIIIIIASNENSNYCVLMSWKKP